MAKTALLTWGLSLLRFKIPFVVLESPFGKYSLSTSSFPSTHTGVKTRSHPTVKQSYSYSCLRIFKNKYLNDEIELDFVFGSPQFPSQHIKGRDKMAMAGGLRFIVYLVSLALSLAALSTLKLHKLLQWLTLQNSDSSNAKTIQEESQTKFSLISEILRAVSLQYSPFKIHQKPSAQQNLPSRFPETYSGLYFQVQTHQYPKASVSAPTSPTKSRHFYEDFPKLSEQMNSSRPPGLQRRCNSESLISFSSSSPLWFKSSRVNVEIRTQTASGVASWYLFVEIPPPSSLVSELAGLCHTSASRICRLSLSAPTHHSYYRKDTISCYPPLLVTYMTQLTANFPKIEISSSTFSNLKSDSTPTETPWTSGAYRNPISSASFCTAIEESESELEILPLNETPSLMTLAPISAGSGASFIFLTPKTHIICRDCGVGTIISTRDSACSPINFFEEDKGSDTSEHSDADGLELDDEGVYFAFDYPDRISYLDGTDEEGDKEHTDESEPTDSHSHSTAEPHKAEGFSNLVTLIKGISDDLLQLESGCQQLIQRVHVNRIELDRVNDSLSYVWNYKDEHTSTTTNEMENSCGSINSNVFSHRYTPMGASFISTTDSCCACNCHSSEKDLGQQPNPEPDSLYLSPLSVDEDEFSETYNSRQYPPQRLSRSSSHRCLFPKSPTFHSSASN